MNPKDPFPVVKGLIRQSFQNKSPVLWIRYKQFWILNKKGQSIPVYKISHPTLAKNFYAQEMKVETLLRLRFLVFQLNILFWDQIVILFLDKMQTQTTHVTGCCIQLGSFLRSLLKNYRSRAIPVKENGRCFQLQDLLRKRRHDFLLLYQDLNKFFSHIL